MLLMDVMKRAHTELASQIAPVLKNDGALRFCAVSRKLNGVTIRESYPTPCRANGLTS